WIRRAALPHSDGRVNSLVVDPCSSSFPCETVFMPNPREPLPRAHDYSPWAGFLSFLVPGLGQIYLGRLGKGLLFLVCLYGLFFYGMALGSWKNVYLPDTASRGGIYNPWSLPVPAANLYNRLQYAGQFWL